VLAAGSYLPDVKAVVAIAAPADAEHVVESFKAHVPAIEMHGEAEVELAGRPFRIRRQFLDDIRDSNLETHVRNLRRPLLILHSPVDETVGVENARRIFVAARHPKSFVALDGADHLLTRRADAIFVADLVSSWCSRYLAAGPGAQEGQPVGVQVEARGEGRFQQAVQLGAHQLTLDEPRSYGGLDSGPSPYDLLAAALGACTSMTLGLYAERKGFSFPPFVVRVDHAKVHAADCVACVEGRTGLIDRFAVRIVFASDLGAELRAKALAIAAKCPVHRTLTSRSHIDTVVESSTEVHAYDAPHGRN
jgi:putative redox protein